MVKYFILISLIIFVSSTNNLSSQLPSVINPCEDFDPEEGSEWFGNPDNNRGLLDLVFCGGCVYMYEFYYREDANGNYEIQITNIILMSTVIDPSNPPNCTGCDIDDVRRLAYLRVFEWLKNEDPLDIVEYEVLSNVMSILQYSCMRSEEIELGDNDLIEVGDLGLPNYSFSISFPPSYFEPTVVNNVNYYNVGYYSVFTPCTGTLCCRMKYNFTWIENTIEHRMEVVEVTWSSSFAQTITFPENCPNPTNCNVKCNELYWDWDINEGFEYEPLTRAKKVFNESDIDLNGIYLSPNPNEGIFSLNIENDFIGIIEITLLDFNGKALFTENINKNNSIIIKEYNFDKYANGTYNLIIKYDNNIISRKLNIIFIDIFTY